VFGIGRIGSIDGADDDVGFREGDEEVVGGDDDVGLREGVVEGVLDGTDDVGLDEMEG